MTKNIPHSLQFLFAPNDFCPKSRNDCFSFSKLSAGLMKLNLAFFEPLAPKRELELDFPLEEELPPEAFLLSAFFGPLGRLTTKASMTPRRGIPEVVQVL
jgi:hypothetical protein